MPQPFDVRPVTPAEVPVLDRHIPTGGAGTALIAAAECLIAARGHEHAAIAVDVDNPGAARLYERLGYADTGGRWTESYTYFDDDGVEREATERIRVLVKVVR